MKKLIMTSMLCLALSPAAMAADGTSADKGKGPHHHGRMFDEMDANKDGAVTKDEAMAFHEKKFDEMDTNKDGKITKEETKAFFQKKKEERENSK